MLGKYLDGFLGNTLVIIDFSLGVVARVLFNMSKDQKDENDTEDKGSYLKRGHHEISGLAKRWSHQFNYIIDMHYNFCNHYRSVAFLPFFLASS